MRLFLEPVWIEWHTAWGEIPDVPSRWMCGRSSLLLQLVLSRDHGLPAGWVSGVPRHGPEGPEIGALGFFTGLRWEAHAWVEVEDDWIVDVTADQFQAPAVIVTSVGDVRYAKGAADTALPEYRERRRQAVENLWPRWEHSEERLSLGSLGGLLGHG